MDAHSSHQGYFSIDKKKGKKARFVEGKVDRKTQTSDDTDAYDLIMRDKERLLSLDEPVRFIFSHSALREGWDNPNVFQICTLKTQGESEIRSRQEIGRGLRLCVNQNGERMDESVLGCEGAVMQVLSSIYDPRALRPENAHDNNVQAKVDEQKLHDREFAKLWQRINRKTFYTVSFDTQELIDRSVRELDAHLNISKVYVKTEYGEQTARLTSREQLEQGQAFVKRHNDQDAADRVALGNVRYDLVGKLVEETGLTRATIAAILQGIAPLVFAQYELNPEDFIIKAGKIINNQKADMIIEHITYNRLEESYSADIFMLANLHGRQGVNAMPADRSLYNYVIYDSDNERRFAHELDVCDKIAVYVKLPGSFFISTPVGKYNPDWAIAFHEGTVKHIYFIAETKGTTLLDRNELRGVEDLKIQCAKAHFAAISNDSVVYDVVDSYDKLMQVVME